MKAVQVERYGTPEVMEFLELPAPSPGPSEVLIKLHAAGVNFIDIYHRTGLYPVTLPYVLGEEGAGEVVQIGSAVSSVKVGDRVTFCGLPGSYAEYVAVPADRTVKIPETLDYQTACALLLQGMTAHYLVNSTYPLKEGEACLVHAAAGGVGLLLVQLAKQKGARVIGTVSTEEKARCAREAGADEVILYKKVDFAKEVQRITNEAGVAVVYDSVGKDTFERSLTCLKPRGYLVLFGQSSGKVDLFDPARLSQGGSLYLTRPSLSNYVADRASLETRAFEVMKLAASKKLSVTVGKTFPLSEARKAHESLEGRKTTGKVLLIP